MKSALKVQSCSHSYCKLKLSFGTGDKFVLRLLKYPDLKYEIVLTNIANGKSTKFSTPFWVTESEAHYFNIPLENIKGDPTDLFDVTVDASWLPAGYTYPVNFIKVELLYYERILQNRLVIPGMTTT